MSHDYFPDGSTFEYHFSMNYSYIVPLTDLDEPEELARMVAEDYVRLDKRNSLAILTRKGWEWCSYEHSRNRDQGDQLLGAVPLFMSKDDLVKRLRWPDGEVERVADDWFSAARNSIGFFDYNHVAAIVGRSKARFEPTCVYPTPKTIEAYVNEPVGWLYVPLVRQLFQQHDLEIELTVADVGDRLDGTDEPEDNEKAYGHRYVSWGVVYGPRGHIAYVELEDDGTPLMPWATAEAILRDHAGVEALTAEMMESVVTDDWNHRRDRL